MTDAQVLVQSVISLMLSRHRTGDHKNKKIKKALGKCYTCSEMRGLTLQTGKIEENTFRLKKCLICMLMNE